MQVLGLLLSLSILVLVHELGHYFARIFKTRVEKFYLFFNPWFSIMRAKDEESGILVFLLYFARTLERPSETIEWGIGCCRCGYCSIAGMVDETKEKRFICGPQEWEFRSKPAWQRFSSLLAAYSLTSLLPRSLFRYPFQMGEEYIPLENARYGLQFSEVALKTGFENGDKIIDIDGKSPKQ